MKWKIKSLNLFAIVAIIGMMSCLSACHKHDHEKVEYGYSVVTFYYTCSPDLLEWCTPVILYGDSVTGILTAELKASDFLPTGERISVTLSTASGDSILTEVNEYAYSIVQRFNGHSGSFYLVETLSDNENGLHWDNSKEYPLYHGFSHVKVDLFSNKDVLMTSKMTPLPMVGSVGKFSDVYQLVHLLNEMTSKYILKYTYEYDRKNNTFDTYTYISRFINGSNSESTNSRSISIDQFPSFAKESSPTSFTEMEEYMNSLMKGQSEGSFYGKIPYETVETQIDIPLIIR